MKKKKLQNKTLQYYLAFGSLVILIVIPSYYLFFEKYYIHEIDEYLFDQKEMILQKSLKTLEAEDISEWNRYNYGGMLLENSGQTEENIFVTEKYDKEEGVENNEPYRVLYSKVKIEGQDYILRLRLSIYEANKIIKSGTLLQLSLFICMMIGFVIITQLIYRKLWKPFYQTLSDIENFNISKNEMPVFPETEIQEFHQLNTAVENLISNSLQEYKIQKEFTENASHEMQTPLAVFQSKLDILLQQQDLTESQLIIIQSLYDATSRLVRMNKNLLLLAKIDNLQFLDVQTLDVAMVLHDSLSFLSEQSEVNRISVSTNMKEEDTIVLANKFLLESLINNLITNSIKHNVPGGQILISLENGRLDIANTGITNSLDSDLLFRRFSRMNEKTRGNGLGLAIVKQICQLYNWNISYSYNDGKHHFAVIFSTAS